MVVINKVALVSIQPFISSSVFRKSGIVQAEVTNTIPVLLVFMQQIIFQVKLLLKITHCHTFEFTWPLPHELIFEPLFYSWFPTVDVITLLCESELTQSTVIQYLLDLQDPW